MRRVAFDIWTSESDARQGAVGQSDRSSRHA